MYYPSNCTARWTQINKIWDEDDDGDDDDDMFNFIMCKHLVKPETKKRYSLLCQTYSDANLFIDLYIY